MKRLMSLITSLTLLLVGCQPMNNQPVPPSEDYAIGVVRTISSKNNSDILYFNEDLEQLFFIVPLLFSCPAARTCRDPSI